MHKGVCMADEELLALPVTVDKSHIITIGERLYGESIELIRELVNNAYDAEATRVDITVGDKEIMIQDKGSSQRNSSPFGTQFLCLSQWKKNYASRMVLQHFRH